MKPINKKMRQWFLWVALIVLSVLVWWKFVCAPKQEERDELIGKVSVEAQKRDLMKQRLDKLSAAPQGDRKYQKALARFSDKIVKGNSTEEISAYTQIWLQEYTDAQGLSLMTYKGLSPSKWRNYPVSLVQFQLSANTQGLSDLLENLETMDKAMRIEKLEVSFRRSKEHDLHVSLTLGTLFVEGLGE